MTTQNPTVRLRDATLRFGEREVWGGLDLDVAPGEFLAVLGPNGSGKTSLLRVLLGLYRLERGTVEVCGREPRRGSRLVGYIPQQKAFDRDVPVRGRDLVRMGFDGHRWGFGRFGDAARAEVDRAIAAVGASDYADAPLGLLSGGEQQRLRIAQALLGDPQVLLCDEPLLSLDLRHQQAGQRAHRPAPPRRGHVGAVRDARDQPDPADGRPRALPRRRAVGMRTPDEVMTGASSRNCTERRSTCCACVVASSWSVHPMPRTAREHITITLTATTTTSAIGRCDAHGSEDYLALAAFSTRCSPRHSSP